MHTNNTSLIHAHGLTKNASQIKARLGVVPQQDNLDNEITVRENLLMYSTQRRRDAEVSIDFAPPARPDVGRVRGPEVDTYPRKRIPSCLRAPVLR